MWVVGGWVLHPSGAFGPSRGVVKPRRVRERLASRKGSFSTFEMIGGTSSDWPDLAQAQDRRHTSDPTLPCGSCGYGGVRLATCQDATEKG